MRCVVTGAAGFLGSHLCEALLTAGHVVVGVDAFVHGPTSDKARNQAALLAHTRYHFHASDLRHDELAEIFSGAEIVFHLAALASEELGWESFDDYLGCNVLATRRLLETLRTVTSLRKLILASSAEVYGLTAAGSEGLPTIPVTPYGVTKLAAEQLCRAYAELYRLPTVILRFFEIFGPRQRPDQLAQRTIDGLWCGGSVSLSGEGDAIRDFVHVSDAIAALVASIEAPAGESYNVGGGTAVSQLELVERLETIAGKKVEREHLPVTRSLVRRSIADADKLRRHVGWFAKVPLNEGLLLQWRERISEATPSETQPVCINDEPRAAVA